MLEIHLFKPEEKEKRDLLESIFTICPECSQDKLDLKEHKRIYKRKEDYRCLSCNNKTTSRVLLGFEKYQK